MRGLCVGPRRVHILRSVDHFPSELWTTQANMLDHVIKNTAEKTEEMASLAWSWSDSTRCVLCNVMVIREQLGAAEIGRFPVGSGENEPR